MYIICIHITYMTDGLGYECPLASLGRPLTTKARNILVFKSQTIFSLKLTTNSKISTVQTW